MTLRAIKDAIRRTPVLGGLAARTYRALASRLRAPGAYPGGAAYWEQRYAGGGDSGDGSDGPLAAFKAEVLNAFVAAHDVRTVIEFGCGDGRQLALARYPSYLGFDVSATAVARCRERFRGDTAKAFRLMGDYRAERADLALSLDVIYHLTEDDVFERYMRTLFDASDRFVIIYSSDPDTDRGFAGTHVRHRPFTRWVRDHEPRWTLMERQRNRYPYDPKTQQGSSADFFIYRASTSR